MLMLLEYAIALFHKKPSVIIDSTDPFIFPKPGEYGLDRAQALNAFPKNVHSKIKDAWKKYEFELTKLDNIFQNGQFIDLKQAENNAFKRSFTSVLCAIIKSRSIDSKLIAGEFDGELHTAYFTEIAFQQLTSLSDKQKMSVIVATHSNPKALKIELEQKFTVSRDISQDIINANIQQIKQAFEYIIQIDEAKKALKTAKDQIKTNTNFYMSTLVGPNSSKEIEALKGLNNAEERVDILEQILKKSLNVNDLYDLSKFFIKLAATVDDSLSKIWHEQRQDWTTGDNKMPTTLFEILLQSTYLNSVLD